VEEERIEKKENNNNGGWMKWSVGEGFVLFIKNKYGKE
jgi:hypothetical protein